MISAASAGHLTTVRLLLAKDADPNAKTDQNRYGHVTGPLRKNFLSLTLACFRTALHYAASKGHKEIAKDLVKSGASVTVQDENGSTALHKASACGDDVITELLLKKGASVATQDKLGQTPLHLAVIEEHERVARMLVEDGADSSVKDRDGNSPLDLCRYERMKSVLKSAPRG